jgi:hypothetical protein
VDEFIEGLSAEAREAMRPLLRQAYDRGFREALATAGQQPAAATAAAQIEQPVPPAPAPGPIAAPVEWVAPGGAGEASGVDGEDGEDDDDATAGETPVPRPILANAMVGTLRRRIIRTFDLERFDIDVLICRSGDPDRRQLKSSARLALYRREEG